MKTENTLLQAPRFLWTPRNFVAAFRNLRLPITTATEAQIADWKASEVWAPYWESIRDFCETSVPCQELIGAVMANAAHPLTTREHRALLEAWVDRHVPGYSILWECDLLRVLNEVLASRGERCGGFEFGKDGRGALPDRYYHLLAEQKYLVVGNHHDILGHFLLFTDPLIRSITEKIIRVSAKGHDFNENARRYGARHMRAPEQRERYEQIVFAPLRPILALMTFSWNLAQEKLYFSEPSPGRQAKFSLLGAFNTVYNTTLSSRLDIQYAHTTVAGLSVLANAGNRNIVMLPVDMRRWLLSGSARNETHGALREELGRRIDRYDGILREVWGGDATGEQAAGHAARFSAIVHETLFAQVWKFRLPVGLRWRKFGRAIQADPLFSKLLTRRTMLALADAQIDVAEAALAVHAHVFAERGGRATPPPAALRLVEAG